MEKDLKILLLDTRDWKINGINLYVKDLAESLSNKPGIVLNVVPSINSRLLILNIFASFLLEQIVVPFSLLFCRYDLVLYPFNGVPFFGIGYKTLLPIIHDVQGLRNPNGWLRKLYFIINYALINSFKKPVVTVGLSGVEDLKFVFPKSKIMLLENSLEKFKTYIKIQKQKKYNLEKGRVLICGGMRNGKDPSYIFTDILPALKKIENIDIHLIGVDPNYCDITKSESFPTVSYHFNIPEKDVFKLFLESNVVIVHTLHEGFGRNYYQAVVANCWVFAKNIPAFNQNVFNGVFLYDRIDDVIESIKSKCQTSERPVECAVEAKSIDYLVTNKTLKVIHESGSRNS
jgi:hypothetical protein